MSTAPGGAATAPSSVCVPCTTGTLEVMVWKFAVCWDTPFEGINAQDPPFAGVTVRLAGSEREATTGDDGKARFTGLTPGSYTIEAAKPGYEDVTDEVASAPDLTNLQLRTSAEVRAHQTSYADVVLRARQYRYNNDGTWSQGRECLRRHPAASSDSAAGGGLPAILWANEPPLLYSRDLAWILFLILIPAAVVLGLVNLFGYFPVYIGVLLAAFEALLTGIIFGEGPGVVACIAALVGFAVSGVALPFVLYAPSHSLVDRGLIATLFSMTAGVWIAFAFGYLPGRREQYEARPHWMAAPPFLYSALIGAVAAVVLFLVFAFTADLGVVWGIVGCVVLVIVGFVPYGASGLCGWAYRNEGEAREYGESGFKLPYVGERYCVQGARGYWSHYGGAEGSYDFAMPDGTRVLCSKEGHVTSFHDEQEYKRFLPLDAPLHDHHRESSGIDYDFDHSHANYVQVRHRDGSLATYGWFRKHGIAGAAWNPLLRDAVNSSSNWTSNGREVSANPVYVRQGQALGAAGYATDDALPAPFPDRPDWGWFIGGVVWAAALIAFLLIMAFTSWDGPPPNDVSDKAFQGRAATDYCPPSNAPPTTDPEQRQHRQECETMRTAFNAAGRTQLPANQGFDKNYCERMTFSYIEQPHATWSTLGFVVLGLIYLGLYASGGPNGKPYKNRMTSTTMYPVILSFILILNGPGSGFFHSSFLMDWAWLDSFGMDCFGAFVIAYNLVRMFNWQWWVFLIWFGVFVIFAFLGATGMLVDIGIGGLVAFMILVGGAFLTEIILTWVCHVVSDYDGLLWFWLGGICGFGVAMLVWKLGHTGGPFCTPAGTLGGPDAAWSHPAWHFLGAFAMFCFSMYFRYQKDPEPCFPRLHFAVLEAPPAGPVPVTDPEPMLASGQTRPPADRYLTVRFDDGATAVHGNQPRSMRKYASANSPLGIPVIPPVAVFRPRGGGQHPNAIG